MIRSVPAYFTAADGTVAAVHLFGANGITIQDQQILIVVVAAVVAVLLGVFLRSFRLGVAMRAVVDDPDLVAMAGARPHRMAQMGWALGFMLAALAGVLIAPLVGQTGLTSTQLTLLALNGFAAAVVGRLRNLPMTFVGALMLGLITQYCVGYLPGHINPGLAAVLTEVVPVLFLFVVLLVIPAARLAPAGRLAVRPSPRVVTARQSVAGAVLLVAGMAVLAVLAGATALATLSQGLAFGIVGLSLVLLVGYAGQVSLCQLTFMGIGAFTMGKVLGGGSWWGALAAVVVSGAVGALVALPALRLRGLYLALATFAFGEVMFTAFFSNSSVISDGTSVGVGRLRLPFMHGVGDRAELMEVAVAAALCALFVGLVRRSAFGRRLVAMSDSPAAFATVGLSSVRTKVIVFTALGGHGRPGRGLLRRGAGRHRRQRRAVLRQPDAPPLRRHLGDPHPDRRAARRRDGGGPPGARDAPAPLAGRSDRIGRRHRDRAARPPPRRHPGHGVVDEPGAPALRRRAGRLRNAPLGPRGGPCRLSPARAPPRAAHRPSRSTT